jgi:hypothetical protein
MMGSHICPSARFLSAMTPQVTNEIGAQFQVTGKQYLKKLKMGYYALK